MAVRKKYNLTLVRAYQKIFNSVEGKKVLYDLVKISGVISSNYSKDPYDTAFKEGQRNMVLRIMTVLKTDYDKLSRLIEEGEKEEGTYE